MTAHVAQLALAALGVNGPEDDRLNWDAIDWRSVEAEVRRLRQRIFTASQAGDHQRVRSLQRLMLRSRANTLLSVRRVSQQNEGRGTASVKSTAVLSSSSVSDVQKAWSRAASGSAGTGRCDAGVFAAAGRLLGH